ncbi:acyl carrier protein [alpha proteobacterium AAP81b]|nr:acyl carrier protein [alpha proteobacterium AAP81b]
MKALNEIFAEALMIDIGRVTDDLTYNSIPEWDSVAHMALIAELEGVYDIMLDTDDIIAMSTPAIARDILTKYGVAL